jgi:hypothetical protein
MKHRRRFGVFEEGKRECPKARQGGDQGGIGDDAGLDGRERPGSALLEPQHRRPSGPTRVERQTPSGMRLGGEQQRDLGVDPRPLKR